ncbi:MAG: hypothetical protein NT028_11985 [candidate division Zixibacteria bacterium]|nr:hypothetical protein [candidate division Zixibacteria bacterium]
MKRHSQRASTIVIAVTALCFVWLLSGYVVSVPAFAEGGSSPLPGENLPADTTITTGSAVLPDGGTTTTDVIEVVVLFFCAVL